MKTPHEAVRALDANFPGFIRDFAAHKIYHVLADGDWREGDEAAIMPVSRELHLVPQIEGRFELAGLLIAALFPALATTTFLGISAATLIGGALFLGVMVGLSFLFRPKTPDKADEKRNEGFAFTGPENVVTQGAAVPLVYGQVHCGSVVVSAGLEVAELSNWSNQPEGPGSTELRSKQYAKMVDVISDGLIEELRTQDIFLDGVALPNFKNTQVQIRTGSRNQGIINGFAAQQTETSVSLELEYNQPLVRAIINQDVDRTRVTLMTPMLQEVDPEDGTVYGAAVGFVVEVSNAGGGYVRYVNGAFTGHTTSQYQRSYLITLPRPGPWNLRVTRNSPKSTKATVQHDLVWSSYTELIDDRVNYNANRLRRSVPSISEAVLADPEAHLSDWTACLSVSRRITIRYNATYTGVWNGTFKQDWTNNPAWMLFDILISRRYGIGSFIDSSPRWMSGRSIRSASGATPACRTARAASSGASPATSRSPTSKKPSI